MCTSSGKAGTFPYTFRFFLSTISTLPPPPLTLTTPRNPNPSPSSSLGRSSRTSSANKQSKKHLPQMRLFESLLILSKSDFHPRNVTRSKKGRLFTNTFHLVSRNWREPIRSKDVPRYDPAPKSLQPVWDNPTLTSSRFKSVPSHTRSWRLTLGMTGRASDAERNHVKSASRAPVDPVVRCASLRAK